MKFVIIVALALVAVTVAVPVDYQPSQIRYELQPQGDYVFGFETDDGTKRDEKGELKQVVDEENKPRDVVVVRGTFSYLKEDGTPETINYFADETGYHAEGPSIPKPVRR